MLTIGECANQAVITALLKTSIICLKNGLPEMALVHLEDLSEKLPIWLDYLQKRREGL